MSRLQFDNDFETLAGAHVKASGILLFFLFMLFPPSGLLESRAPRRFCQVPSASTPTSSARDRSHQRWSGWCGDKDGVKMADWEAARKGVPDAI